MTKLAEQLKQGAGHAWESLSEGWRELSARASGALTRFVPSTPSDKGGADAGALGRRSRWGLMAADVLDTGNQLIVRLEAPGMRREDFTIEVHGDILTVRGEKRLDHESSEGGYRVVQCAYGSFRRDVSLPVAVNVDQTKASYRDGVLRIEMPKVERSRTRRIAVNDN